MKKFLLSILIFSSFVAILYPARPANAQVCLVNNKAVAGISDKTACTAAGGTWQTGGSGGSWDPEYQLLAPLPCNSINCDSNNQFSAFNFSSAPTNPGENSALCLYLNLMIDLFIGICAVLAVIMIVLGGLEYMTSELISSKEQGKERITHAILGLILALAAWTILYQINSSLVDCNVHIPDVTVKVNLGGESARPFNAISSASLKAISPSINCPGGGGAAALPAISQSFVGHATYDQNQRGQATATTAYVDCSSYVDQVYQCAGLASPGNNTNEMFNGATPVNNMVINGTSVTVNGAELKPGDLLGWVAGGEESSGHVVMYIGNGQIIDAQDTGGANGSVSARPISANLQSRIKFIKKHP